jgi:hypothetical protein
MICSLPVPTWWNVIQESLDYPNSATLNPGRALGAAVLKVSGWEGGVRSTAVAAPYVTEDY